MWAAEIDSSRACVLTKVEREARLQIYPLPVFRWQPSYVCNNPSGAIVALLLYVKIHHENMVVVVGRKEKTNWTALVITAATLPAAHQHHLSTHPSKKSIRISTRNLGIKNNCHLPACTTHGTDGQEADCCLLSPSVSPLQTFRVVWLLSQPYNHSRKEIWER